MSERLTIVAYHYVRDLKNSRYPEIKGLSTEQFESQVQYFKKNYSVIGANDLIDAIQYKTPLPEKSILLTFDDGYIDHYTEVFPVLDRENISGCFFPPAKCILHHEVLDVNKIHFVLASTPDKQKLVDFILDQISKNRDTYDLLPAETYWENFGRESKETRFDSADVVFCKHTLQRELPLELRESIIDELFRMRVTDNERSFSQELYMNQEQIKTIQRHGMYVGSHGYNHFWLNSITREQQEYEVDQSLTFLKSVGASIDNWIMCYPYGAYNDDMISVLESRNCIAALTTRPGVADINVDHALTLPRLDTNDLPN